MPRAASTAKSCPAPNVSSTEAESSCSALFYKEEERTQNKPIKDKARCCSVLWDSMTQAAIRAGSGGAGEGSLRTKQLYRILTVTKEPGKLVSGRRALEPQRKAGAKALRPGQGWLVQEWERRGAQLAEWTQVVGDDVSEEQGPDLLQRNFYFCLKYNGKALNTELAWFLKAIRAALGASG